MAQNKLLRILVILAISSVSLPASAQIRIEAGTSIGGFRTTSSGYGAKAGVTAGAFYDIGFQGSPYEFLALGLQYTETGYDSSGMDGKVTWLQLPIESRTKFGINGNFYLIADAGIFLGYALSRMTKVYWTYDSTPVETDISEREEQPANTSSSSSFTPLIFTEERFRQKENAPFQT